MVPTPFPPELGSNPRPEQLRRHRGTQTHTRATDNRFTDHGMNNLSSRFACPARTLNARASTATWSAAWLPQAVGRRYGIGQAAVFAAQKAHLPAAPSVAGLAQRSAEDAAEERKKKRADTLAEWSGDIAGEGGDGLDGGGRAQGRHPDRARRMPGGAAGLATRWAHVGAIPPPTQVNVGDHSEHLDGAAGDRHRARSFPRSEGGRVSGRWRRSSTGSPRQ